jgi:hypothetical protein
MFPSWVVHVHDQARFASSSASSPNASQVCNIYEHSCCMPDRYPSRWSIPEPPSFLRRSLLLARSPGTPTCTEPFHLSAKYTRPPPQRLVFTQPLIHGQTRAGWTRLTMPGNTTSLNPDIFRTLMKPRVTVSEEATSSTRRSALRATLSTVSRGVIWLASPTTWMR